jgi:hypothetical protein
MGQPRLQQQESDAAGDITLFRFQVRLTRLHHAGELLPWDYLRDIGPSEYRQVFGRSPPLQPMAVKLTPVSRTYVSLSGYTQPKAANDPNADSSSIVREPLSGRLPDFCLRVFKLISQNRLKPTIRQRFGE